MLEMKDWRGNTLTPGCVVLYPRTSGRSCEVQEGILWDVWRVYKPPGSWEWKRLPDGQEVPTEEVPKWDRHYDPAKPTRPCENELRVRIQPTRSSRDFHRGGMTWDLEAGKYEPPAEFKPITLTICENVTFLAPASREAEIRHRSALWVFLVGQHVTVTDKEGTVTGLLTGVGVDVIRVWTEQGECAVPTENVVSVVAARFDEETRDARDRRGDPEARDAVPAPALGHRGPHPGGMRGDPGDVAGRVLPGGRHGRCQVLPRPGQVPDDRQGVDDR